MASRINQWINQRWPLSVVVHWGAREEIPGGAKFAYIFGSSTLFLFILQSITGVWQMLYYVPTVDHGYDSVAYLRTQVPFGWLIHGLHYWGSNAFIVLIGLHILRVFIWGAYKKPRELIWLSGLVLLLLSAAMIFTGALLPWDQLGYWAGEVGTSIAGTTPLIGDFMQRLMRGGEPMGQLTLSRFFAFHVAILPALITFMLIVHLIAFRQFGNVGPWKQAQRQHTGQFWPQQVFKDMIIIGGLLMILIALCVYSPAPITGPADPLDNTYDPKPEWPFLFLYQALKAFKGTWEPVGTTGIPLLLITLLVLLPFVDRNPQTNPLRRPIVISLGILWVGGLLALTILGHYSRPGLEESPIGQAAIAPVVEPATTQTSETPPNTVKMTPAEIAAGETLFTAKGCLTCHAVKGHGGALGPDLSNEGNKGRSASWLITQIRNPSLHNPNTTMPAYARMVQQQANQLAAYLLSLKSAATSPVATPTSGPMTAQLPAWGRQGPPGPAAQMIGDPEHGQILFDLDCRSCHGKEGRGHIPNPGATAGVIPSVNPINPTLYSKTPVLFAEQIDRFIQHGSKPAGPSPQMVMPAFGDTQSLTQQQATDIEAYIMSLNGVDRAKILHPGVEPRTFFYYAIIIFGAIYLGLGLAYALGRFRQAPHT